MIQIERDFASNIQTEPILKKKEQSQCQLHNNSLQLRPGIMLSSSHFLRVYQILNKNRALGPEDHTNRNKIVFLWLSSSPHSVDPKVIWLLEFLSALSSSLPHKLANTATILSLLTSARWPWLSHIDIRKASVNLKMSYFLGASLVSFTDRTLMAKSHVSPR